MKRLTRSLFFATSVTLILGSVTMTQAQPATPSPQQSRAQQLMGETAPKLAELTDGVLYADIWERPELSKREARSIIYTANYDALSGLVRFLLEDCCAGHPDICKPMSCKSEMNADGKPIV